MHQNTLVLGLQWGDEGKGKIVDVLSENVYAVCRFQGGHNAGHTLKVNDITTVLHLIPSGVLHPEIKCVIGNGVVLSLEALSEELSKLSKMGISLENRLFISNNCPLILPSHVLIDKVRDKKESIGTTGRGIGPAYEDKVGRRAIRFGDLNDSAALEKKVKNLLEVHNKILVHLHKSKPCDPQETLDSLLRFKNFYKKYSADISELIQEWHESNHSLLFEGAQGTFLDIDHGTYPYVTSSSTTAGGVSTGLGIGPKSIDKVIGISKAYATRVGEGPFPTEVFDQILKEISSRGNEFGATTGRPRRCGWLDLVLLKKAIFLNSVDSLCLTKIDVLDSFEEINLCIDYKDNKPIYKRFDGWMQNTSQIKKYDDLPQKLKEYISFIQDFTKTKVSILSIGPSRDQSIYI